MTQPSPPPPPPSGPQGPPPPQGPPAGKKKGLSPWAWVAIGCGVLLLLTLLVVGACTVFVGGKAKDFAERFEENPEMTSVELMIRMNPELELVEKHEEEGRVTVRNRSTGETVTVDVSDVKEGRIRWESDEGSGSIGMDEEEGTFRVEGPEGEVAEWGGQGELPDWLPAYPGATAQQLYRTEEGGRRSGSFVLETDADLDEVVTFYRERLEGEGFSLERGSFEGGGMRSMMLQGSADGRDVNVAVAREEGSTQVTLIYNEQIE